MLRVRVSGQGLGAALHGDILSLVNHPDVKEF